jgi:hypothetical protein
MFFLIAQLAQHRYPIFFLNLIALTLIISMLIIDKINPCFQRSDKFAPRNIIPRKISIRYVVGMILLNH